MRHKVVWSKHLFMHLTWLDPEIKTKLGYLTSDLQKEKLWGETSNIRGEKQKIVSNASSPIIIFIFDNYRFYRFIFNGKLPERWLLGLQPVNNKYCDYVGTREALELGQSSWAQWWWWWRLLDDTAGDIDKLVKAPALAA